MTEKIVYCVDISGYDPDAADVVTLHFADIGGVYGGVYYAEKLKQPGLYTANLFQPGTTSGESKVGSGETKLQNADGTLDYLKTWGFDGRDIVFKKFTLSLGLVLITGCTMEQATFPTGEVSFLTKDLSAQLNVPIQPTKYAGTNELPAGIEGTDDIKGQAKPLTFGPTYNQTPVWVNTSLLIGQVHDGLATIPAGYDMGVPWPQEADYTDQADMEANAPAPGKYRVWSSAVYGTFLRLGSSPAGTFTVDVVEGATAADRTAAQVAKRIALRALTSGEISSVDVSALDSLNSAEVGISIKDGSTTTILAALDQVLGSIGAWHTFDINRVLRMGRLDAPTGTPDLTLTKDDYLSIERVASSDATKGVPPYKVNLQYEKNWTVQSASELAGSVTYSGIQTWDNNSISEMPAVQYSSSCNLYKNYLLVIGGWINPSSPSMTDSVIRLDLENPTGAWDDAGVTPLPEARYDHASVVYGDYLYVIGGVTGAGNTASVIRLDLTNPSGAWDDAGVTDLPATRRVHSAVIHGSYVYVIGGDVSGGDSPSVIRLDLSNPTGAWDDAGVTDLPSGRPYNAAVVHDNYLYVIGGGSFYIIRLDLTNPSSAWVVMATSPDLRSGHTAVVFDNYLYVIAGNVSGSVGSGSVIRIPIHNLTGTWEALPDLPDKRVLHSSVVYRGNIFVVGGTNATAYQPNTYIYRILVERESVLWLASEYRTVTDSDASIQTVHLLAPEMSVDTLLVDVDDAQAEVTRRLNLYKADPEMLQVEMHSSVVAYIQPGKKLLQYSPRFGLSAGKLFIIIGIAVDWEQRKTTLTVWG